MLVGFNHNIRYKGEVFHVQTEDSGRANPHIITLLYRGGTILCSKKTDYSDILRIDNLETVVEELMKDQHKDMLRRLKNGEFDSRAFPGSAADGAVSSPPPTPSAPSSAPRPENRPAERPTKSLDEIIVDYFASDEED